MALGRKESAGPGKLGGTAPTDHASDAPGGRKFDLRKIATNRWVLGGLAIIAAVHAVAIAAYALRSAPETALPPPPAAEFELGRYAFHSPRPDFGELATADFAVHLTLLPNTEAAARTELEARRFRVRQDIEQLLRRAKGADFEDPELSGLKRQIQAQINDTLGMRAVGGVIITDLERRFDERRKDRPQSAPEALTQH